MSSMHDFAHFFVRVLLHFLYLCTLFPQYLIVPLGKQIIWNGGMVNNATLQHHTNSIIIHMTASKTDNIIHHLLCNTCVTSF